MGGAQKKLLSVTMLLVFSGMPVHAQNATDSPAVHVWQLQEITLTAARHHDNYYTDVTCWVELEGPHSSRRVYGFWDGGSRWGVRFVLKRLGEHEGATAAIQSLTMVRNNPW